MRPDGSHFPVHPTLDRINCPAVHYRACSLCTDAPTVLASCLKLWLRELCDPLVPEELYNDCITHAKEPETCVQIVKRLPTINRRVVVFVVSFVVILFFLVLDVVAEGWVLVEEGLYVPHEVDFCALGFLARVA